MLIQAAAGLWYLSTSEDFVGYSVPTPEEKKSNGPALTDIDPAIAMRSGAGSCPLYYDSSVCKITKCFTQKTQILYISKYVYNTGIKIAI